MNQKTRIFAGCPRYSYFFAFAGIVFLSSGCMVGPKYQRPTATVPVEYKEPPPDNFKEVGEWKQAEPNDGMIRGKWWEIFNDPELNELEEQVNVSNQNILAAEAQFRGAKIGRAHV
jgi:outer membrane protein TolC